MKRYSPTERIGVNETERIVINNIGWIFREQPIADVGIDGIIEKVENGEPTGKFIAVQIKSGSGNFYKTEKGLYYYATNIHCNYWLNLCIPIILVAHIPEEGKTYWQEITQNTLKKSKKRWKIEIPYKQEFSKKSENRLANIASEKNDEKFDIYRGRVDSNEIDDIIDDLKSLSNATDCLNNIATIIERQTKETRDMGDKINQLSQKKLLNYTSELSILYKEISRTMNLTSKRIETEVELFSQLYSIGINALEKFLITLNTFNLKFEDFESDTSGMRYLPDQIDCALSEYMNLIETIKSVPTYNFPYFKEAKNQHIEVLSFLIYEFQDAKELTKKALEKL